MGSQPRFRVILTHDLLSCLGSCSRVRMLCKLVYHDVKNRFCCLNREWKLVMLSRVECSLRATLALEAQPRTSPTATLVYPQFAKPTLKQRLKANFLGGETKAYTDSAHFSKPTRVYIWKCPIGSWILDYKHGFNPHFLCPRSNTAHCPCENQE